MTNQAIRWLSIVPLTLVCSVAAFAQAAATGPAVTPQRQVVVLVVSAKGQGANGSNITPEQFAKILKGMNPKDVEQALGKPSLTTHYGNQEGPTWVYHMLEPGKLKAFVDFDVVGAVVATSKKMDLDNDGD